jgi:hypothetical protein
MEGEGTGLDLLSTQAVNSAMVTATFAPRIEKKYTARDLQTLVETNSFPCLLIHSQLLLCFMLKGGEDSLRGENRKIERRESLLSR